MRPPAPTSDLAQSPTANSRIGAESDIPGEVPSRVHPVVWMSIGVAVFAAVFLFAVLFGFLNRPAEEQSLATTAATKSQDNWWDSFPDADQPTSALSDEAPDSARTATSATPIATVTPPGEEIPKRDAADTRRIITAAEESVVMLEVPIRGETAKATGSGFVVRAGVVVTNYHVIEDAATVLVKFENGRDAYSVGYLAADKTNDLALLKCDTESIRPLTLGALPEKLDTVFAIGAPRGFSGTVSNGIVSGLAEWKRTGTVMIQTTAPISPGSSGGPLLNESGEVIGVTTEALTNSQNMNFAVAATHVASLLTVPQTVAHPWLDLPISAAAKRRDELQQLWDRIDKLKKEGSEALALYVTTYNIGLQAQSECDELFRQYEAFEDQMENYRLAGDATRFHQATSELESGRWQRRIDEAIATKRSLLAKSEEEKKRCEDLLSEAQKLFKEYEELRAQQVED